MNRNYKHTRHNYDYNVHPTSLRLCAVNVEHRKQYNRKFTAFYCGLKCRRHILEIHGLGHRVPEYQFRITSGNFQNQQVLCCYLYFRLRHNEIYVSYVVTVREPAYGQCVCVSYTRILYLNLYTATRQKQVAD
jgi:hypothetical protein